MSDAKNPDRLIKSVNFTDRSLFDFACRRADSLHGGNFTSYILALIERDRSLPEVNRASFAFEELIGSIVEEFGGQPVSDGSGCDFFVPSLNVVVEARARFPRERAGEYKMIGELHRVAARSPGVKSVLVYPDDLSLPEKERFNHVIAVGINSLKVMSLSELRAFLTRLNTENASAQSSGAVGVKVDSDEPRSAPSRQ